MEIGCTSLLCLTVILDSFGISLQSWRLPDEAHIPESSERPSEPTARARSRSPTLRETFPGVLGYRFEDLEFIQLRPYCNPNQVFKLQKYVFPPEKPIGMRTRSGVLKPMPVGERIVLLRSNGDVCAMMDRRDNKHIVLRGIFIYVFGKLERAKLNIDTGAVDKLTKDESDGCPVSTRNQIAKNYAVFRADIAIHHTASASQSLATYNPFTGSPTPPEPPLHDCTRSPTIRQTFQVVLGYRFEDLGSIRLIPHKYPYRIFELRIYAFPPDKPIGLRTRNHVLNPMPTGDQIVLSTSNGDVYAILQKKPNRVTILRPIFTSNLGMSERVRINMNSGEVEELCNEENLECPVTFKEVIPKVYRVFHV